MSTVFTQLAVGATLARVALARLALPALIVVGVQGGGTFKPLRGVSTPGGAATARAADVAALKATVARIDELFRRDPALAPPPSDVLIQPFGTVSAAPASMQTQPALMAGYSIFFLHPKERCGSSGCRVDAGEGPELRVRINDPIALIGLGGGTVSPIGRQGSLATMYRGKRQIGEIAGFPQYENGAVAIGRRGHEVWLPVTREELLQAHLEDLRASRGMEKLVARYEQELATLEDRSGPAFCCHEDRTHPSGTTDARAEGASPIVRLNPSYFDRSAGAAVQLLVIGTEHTYAVERAAKPTDPNFELMRAIREKLHWAALAALAR